MTNEPTDDTPDAIEELLALLRSEDCYAVLVRALYRHAEALHSARMLVTESESKILIGKEEDRLSLVIDALAAVQAEQQRLLLIQARLDAHPCACPPDADVCLVSSAAMEITGTDGQSAQGVSAQDDPATQLDVEPRDETVNPRPDAGTPAAALDDSSPAAGEQHCVV